MWRTFMYHAERGMSSSNRVRRAGVLPGPANHAYTRFTGKSPNAIISIALTVTILQNAQGREYCLGNSTCNLCVWLDDSAIAFTGSGGSYKLEMDQDEIAKDKP